jgi:dihydroorotase
MPQALDYRNRIAAAIPGGSSFNPLMTLYLTDSTPPEVTHVPVHHAAPAVAASVSSQ